MLGDTKLIAPLLKWLDRVKPRQVIWDPVFASSSGGKLISAGKWNRTLENLLRRTTIWTPNIPEAEWILNRPIKNITDMESAISALHNLLHDHLPVARGFSPALGPKGRESRWILLKGGHLPKKTKHVLDLLTDGKKIHRFKAKRRPKNPRGTGCTLASALLAYLFQGWPLPRSVAMARSYLKSAKF
jgi:hydroxymethylpyrimidine/phosphomethylpyrimidine kinase